MVKSAQRAVRPNEEVENMAKEERLAVCKQHWAVAIIPGLIVALLVVFAISIMDVDPIVSIVVLVIAAIIVLCKIISYNTCYIALTKTKVIGHIGFIKSKSLSAPLSKVQDISISNGLFGKIFGYHTITFDTAGTGHTEFVFRYMAKAQAFVDAVQEQIDQR